MKRIIICVLVLLTGMSACKKNDDKQAAADDKIIQEFIAAKGITAQKNSSGLYYVISAPGSGAVQITNSTTVNVKYTGRLLSGTVFDQGTITYKLGQLIEGWQVGVPLIQNGGKIRLLIPSGLAYGASAQGSIPANSVLDFDIELINATN